jgi:maltose alpha-D-glucosyltransferase/alpha-amylase
MPGVPFIWYGDEIGLRSFDDMVSKEGGYDRTGVRTPMQWSNAPNAGFSTAFPETLYLPIDPAPDRPTVEQQAGDPNSLLNSVRKLVTIRTKHPALQASGDFVLLCAKPGLYPLIFQRQTDQETFIIALNPSSQSVTIEIPLSSTSLPEVIYSTGSGLSLQSGNLKIHLTGISGAIYRVR